MTLDRVFPLAPAHAALALLALLAAADVAATPDGGGKGILVPIPILGPCVAAAGCHVVHPGFSDCDNSSITQALTRSPVEEIRVVAGSSSETVAIADRSLRLYGGFADCDAAYAGSWDNPEIVTTIDGGGIAQPTVSVTASTATARTVEIERIAITGTDGAAQGGLRIAGLAGQGRTSPLQVSLRNSRVHGNAAVLGGGIYVRDAQLRLESGVLVNGNSAAQRGGGVHCVAAAFEIESANVALDENIAVLDGGGLYADDCHVQARGYFRSNGSSLGSGGGVFARGGSTLMLGEEGGEWGRITFNGNRANLLDGGSGTLGGGALYVTGTGTDAVLLNADFLVNGAGGNAPAPAAPASVGGAIAAFDNANVSVTRIAARPDCVRPADGQPLPSGFCTLLLGNMATGAGGAVYASNANTSLVAAALLFNRSGDGGTITFVGSGLKRVDTALIATSSSTDAAAGRTLDHVIEIVSGSALLRSLTLADNQPALASIGMGIASVDLRTLLIDDVRWLPPPALSFDASAPPAVTCVDAFETDSFPPGAIAARTSVPDWTPAQRGAFDYRLNPGSDQIDTCSLANYTAFEPALRDVDLEHRGFDAPIVNIGGPVDVGMDEFVILPVFADGFESGSMP